MIYSTLLNLLACLGALVSSMPCYFRSGILFMLCRVPPPLHTLKIWGAWVYSPRSYGAEFVFFYVAAKATYIRLLFGKMGVFRP